MYRNSEGIQILWSDLDSNHRVCLSTKQPQKLELGFTLMFCLSEESLANHIGERHLREDIKALEEQKKEIDELEKQKSIDGVEL